MVRHATRSHGDLVSEDPAAALAPRTASLNRTLTLQRVREQLIQFALFVCAMLSIATTVAIVAALLREAVIAIPPNTAFFQDVSIWDFLTDTQWTPQYEPKHFGIMPLLGGTFLVAGIAALVGIPIGMLTAVYLSEYSSPRMRSIVKPILELLAGIPTVVFGYFALIFITPWVLKPIFQDLLGLQVDVFNAASAGIIVGIMIIPTISSLSEDVLRAVPQGLREAGYALGGTKFDVSTKVVVPAALSGIIASFLLAMSRAVGETMAVVIAGGMKPTNTFNPLESAQTMTAYIVNVSLGDTPAGTIEYKSLYAVALTLFVITLAMNILSQMVLRRFREVYQ